MARLPSRCADPTGTSCWSKGEAGRRPHPVPPAGREPPYEAAPSSSPLHPADHAPSRTPLVTWSDRPGEHTRADQSSSRVTVSHRECLAPLLDQCPDHLSEIVGPEGLRHEHVGPGIGCLHQVLIPDVCRPN